MAERSWPSDCEVSNSYDLSRQLSISHRIPPFNLPPPCPVITKPQNMLHEKFNCKHEQNHAFTSLCEKVNTCITFQCGQLIFALPYMFFLLNYPWKRNCSQYSLNAAGNCKIYNQTATGSSLGSSLSTSSVLYFHIAWNGILRNQSSILTADFIRCIKLIVEWLVINNNNQ